MQFDIVTIFPGIFGSYFGESILARAQKENLIKINVHNLRDYTTDKHQTVDDTPYGGGAGMVLKVEPIYKAVVDVLEKNSQGKISVLKSERKADEKTKVILFSAKGKKYTQEDAKRLSKMENLILICGRYEGVDERVAENIIDEEFSIGEYVLTGGEIPAMVLIDSVSRLLPGVLGNETSLDEESYSADLNYKEYPHYTKPEEFNGWKVPKVLLSGNHKEIEEWKRNHSS